MIGEDMEVFLETAEALDAAIARAERAEAALAKYRAELADRLYEPCVWRIDENANDYITGCDGDWFDVSFGGMKYCPNCGHPVRIASSHNDLLSSDEEDR